jgi:hypothetical protein
MIRKLACAMAVMVVAVGFVIADDVTCRIEGIADGKATCQKYSKAKKGAAPEKVGDTFTVTIAKDCAVHKGMFDKDTKKVVKGDAYEGGLTALAEAAKKAADKGGVNVIITTPQDGGKGDATLILVVGGGGKKKAAE